MWNHGTFLGIQKHNYFRNNDSVLLAPPLPIEEEQKTSRPELAPYTPAHVVAASKTVTRPREDVPDFPSLIVGNFASGKSSALTVS